MASDSLPMLLRQLDTGWSLLGHHLAGLTTEESLWRPAASGLHVQRAADGRWIADWRSHEGHDLGPPSIAWTSWHTLFWWSMVFDRNFGDASLTRKAVAWPGTAGGVRAAIESLHARWRADLAVLGPGNPASAGRALADTGATVQRRGGVGEP